MMRYSLLFSSAVILFLSFTACKKSDKNNSARTVANISGSYNFTALSANLNGVNYNLYDTLPDCEKDNVIALDANGSAQFVDAGVSCTPPSDSTGAWHLSPDADSLYLGNQASLIKTFDGKTLVLASQQSISGFTAEITMTLVKQ